VALLIFSAGPLTDPRLRTLDARTLATCAIAAVLALMVASFALGYRSAHRAPVAQRVDGSVHFDLERPEVRALIARLGTLSSRITLLENEAGALARRLGVTRSSGEPSAARSAPAAAEAAVARSIDGSAARPLPSGGPFIPLQDPPTRRRTARGHEIDFDISLRSLESEMATLEASVAALVDNAVAQSLVRMAFPSRLPVWRGVTSSGFGARRDPFTGRRARHEGLDFPAPMGAPILASAGGRVVYAGVRGPYGKTVVIDHGNGLATLYGHASRVLVRRGDLIMPRQQIAAVGSTGRSTGAHLHFEVIRNGVRVEPRDYLALSGAPIGRP
jgi:murein DD-endopeptidase MepM/ murein hydrolase activator NlpD